MSIDTPIFVTAFLCTCKVPNIRVLVGIMCKCPWFAGISFITQGTNPFGCSTVWFFLNNSRVFISRGGTIFRRGGVLVWRGKGMFSSIRMIFRLCPILWGTITATWSRSRWECDLRWNSAIQNHLWMVMHAERRRWAISVVPGDMISMHYAYSVVASLTGFRPSQVSMTPCSPGKWEVDNDLQYLLPCFRPGTLASNNRLEQDPSIRISS